MNYFYWTDGDEVKGPLSLQELLAFDADTLARTLVCCEGEDQWRPLAELVATSVSKVGLETDIVGQKSTLVDRPSVSSTPSIQRRGSHLAVENVVSTISQSPGIQQGAVIGGWLCFILGMGVMYLSLWAFIIYVPLFLVGFILSIIAMAQRRIIGGIALLLITLIVPPVLWFCTAMIRGDQFMKKHLPPDKLLEYNFKKEESNRIAKQLINAPSDHSSNDPLHAEPKIPSPSAGAGTEFAEAAPNESPAKTPDSIESNYSTSGDSRTLDHVADEKRGTDDSFVESKNASQVVELNSDIAPIVYEFKAATTTSRETIAKYVLGYAYRDMDEFSKHDFVTKLDAMIKQRETAAKSDELYGVSVDVNLSEYDFDKQVFPIGDKYESNGSQSYLSITVRPKDNGDSLSNSNYVVCFADTPQIHSFPVDLDQARKLGPTLRQSRQARISYIGTLQKCVEKVQNSGNTGSAGLSNKYILLNVQEMRMTLEKSGQMLSCQLPGKPASKVEVSVATVNETRGEVSGLPPAKRLNADDINDWDLDRVRYAINEIYARYGVEFPKPDVQAWAERQSWYHRVPGRTSDMAEQMFTEDDKFNLELLAARRTTLRTSTSDHIGDSVVLAARSQPTISNPPVPSSSPVNVAVPLQAATTKPEIDEIPELSPERAITDVWTTNPQTTVANFRSRYSGKIMRYTGTVVRKNAKENLLVFRGGGFMANAYDVQINLNEDRTPGFKDVAVGDRLIIVATIDRIVPPALGVGSNSIRLSDGWIYRRIH